MMLNVLLIIAASLFGLYEIVYGFYACHINGFKFYAVAGIAIGMPFVLIGLILLVQPDRSLGGWEVLLLLLWLVGVSWKAWRKRTTSRLYPVEWARWEKILYKR